MEIVRKNVDYKSACDDNFFLTVKHGFYNLFFRILDFSHLGLFSIYDLVLLSLDDFITATIYYYPLIHTSGGKANNFYSLPNKAFEYIISALPLTVSNLLEMGNIIDENKYGWKFSAKENAIIAIINTITQDNIYEKE